MLKVLLLKPNIMEASTFVRIRVKTEKHEGICIVINV